MYRVRFSRAGDHQFAVHGHIADNALASNSETVLTTQQQTAYVTCTGGEPREGAALVNQENLDMVNIRIAVADLFHRDVQHVAEFLSPGDAFSNLSVDVCQLETIFTGLGE